MTTIAVIDYGMGNLHSVCSALVHARPDARVEITSSPDHIRAADRVIFPGVGAIRDCIGELQRQDLTGVIRECADTKPLLGICLGMQALMDFSEENDGTDCLSLVPGRVCFFGPDLTEPHSGERLKIPHMGWSQVRQTQAHPLWNGIPDESRYYFVHSYYVDPEEAALTAGATFYGREFTAALARDNIFAVQFHPEKSQQAGLTLLANFTNWDGGL